MPSDSTAASQAHHKVTQVTLVRLFEARASESENVGASDDAERDDDIAQHVAQVGMCEPQPDDENGYRRVQQLAWNLRESGSGFTTHSAIREARRELTSNLQRHVSKGRLALTRRTRLLLCAARLLTQIETGLCPPGPLNSLASSSSPPPPPLP